MGPLTLLPMFGLALCLSRLTHVSHAVAFFLVTALVIVTLYVGALAGALWWTALAAHLIGFILLASESLRLARRSEKITVPLPFVLLALLCLWFWIVHGGDQYFLYDEYAHWGIFLKEMLALDGLWTGDTNSMHPRYPPGASLWQYFFNAFLPASEGKAYFAHFLLLLAPLLVLWNNLRWSEPLWIVAILALVLLAIANFGLGVSTLYVDQIIGVWYLGTLLAAVADNNLASRRLALYAAPLAVIALLKDAGLAFAMAVAAILAVLVCRQLLPSERIRPALLKAALAGVLLVAPTLLCVQVWSWNRNAVGAAQEIQSVDGVVTGMVSATTGIESEVDAEIERRLAEVFFDQQLSNAPVTWDFNEFSYGIRELFTDSYRLTTFGLLVGFLLWWTVIAYRVLKGESRSKWLVLAAGVLITALAYIASLHLSYRFAFGERGLELPSYVRYVHVVALPMLLLSFCPLLPAFREAASDRIWRTRAGAVTPRTAVFAAAVIALYAFETPYLRPILQSNPTITLRAELEPLLEQIRASVGPSKLWIYFPGDSPNGFIGRLLQYLLTPTPTAIERSDNFLHHEDAATIAATWGDFDYIWIPSPLTADAAAALDRFSGNRVTGGLFRLLPSTTGLTLERIDHSD